MPWEQMLDMYIQTKYQGSTKRRDICPRCGEVSYLLETPRGLNCRYCGFNESNSPMHFVPRTPENPPV